MDLLQYTEEMSKSIWDKAFFMDKIGNSKLVIDFGCANGALITMLGRLFPETTFYGYDINSDLIDMAVKAKQTNNIFFFDKHNFNSMLYLALTNYKQDEICLNLSCVLHEVYSQAYTFGEQRFDDLQAIINTLQPQYITIRDMYFFNHNYQSIKVPDSILNPILDKVDAVKLEDFSATYGPICKWRELTHFLMKYQWKDNDWDKEMSEDYYVWSLNNFIARVNTKSPYKVIFENHYQLPYLLNKWKKEYNFCNPEACTHIQVILRRMDDD